MISKEAQKSIKTYKRIASFFSFLYRTPNEMTRGRLGFVRWFNNLAGTINPKIKDTIKEEIFFGDIRTLKSQLLIQILREYFSTSMVEAMHWEAQNLIIH